MNYIIYSVEDDQNIAKIINLTLSKQGYIVHSFYNGQSFMQAFRENLPDMILLDLMLPDCSGYDLLKEIRNNASYDDIQIIIVSAKSQVMDKVDGFDLGADDYIEKPFDILELISRVNAKSKKSAKMKYLTVGNISINKETHICKRLNKEIKLTNTEFAILYNLLENVNNVVSRDTLLQYIWGADENYETRTIDVHINSLRNKLGDDGKKILSVYGVGYRFLQ